MYYYKTVTRPVTEYGVCCLAFKYYGRTARPTGVQRRAVRIIFGNEVDLESIAIIQDIPLLADRRDKQTRQMFIAMHDSSHCLYRHSHSHVARAQLLRTIEFRSKGQVVLKTRFYYMPCCIFNEHLQLILIC